MASDRKGGQCLTILGDWRVQQGSMLLCSPNGIQVEQNRATLPIPRNVPVGAAQLVPEDGQLPSHLPRNRY